jgi:RNA polymerase sigma-70 factor, ECF subfamily
MVRREVPLEAKDAAELVSIFEDSRAWIRRSVSRIVGPDEAEDIAQETFIKAARSWKDFEGRSSRKTWLRRIATNLALDRLRSPDRRNGGRTARGEGEDAASGPRVDEGNELCGRPDHDLWRKERYRCYRRFIGMLPEGYRRIVALTDLGDLGVREIADLLGLSEGVVKIRLHRGRRKLLEALRKHCAPEHWL